MPPKKKVPTKSANSAENPIAQQKPASQQLQPKSTIQTTSSKPQKSGQTSSAPPINQPRKQPSKTQSIKLSLSKDNSKSSGLVPTSRPQLTEAQILRMRRQKFKLSGAGVLSQNKQVTEERMKKFGFQPKQSRQQIEQRKKKFSNPSSTAILTQDDEILRMRRQKFALASNSIPNTQNPDVLQQRKKKFAKVEQNLISLDDQIAKNRQKGKKIQSKDRKFRRNERQGKPSRKFQSIDKNRRRQPRQFRPKGSKGRVQGNKFGGKSRIEIFGKRKFIKRSGKPFNERRRQNGNKHHVKKEQSKLQS